VCYIFVFVSFMSLSMLTKLNTLKQHHLAFPAFPKMPCCFSYITLTGILVNFRLQSRPVLVRTVLTSSNALSCLLHLLITSANALADMVEDCIPLGFRRSRCRWAIFPFTCGGEREISCCYYLFLVFVIGSNRNILTMKISQSTVVCNLYAYATSPSKGL